MPTPSILVFAGSTRTGSFNEKLAALAAARLAALGAAVTPGESHLRNCCGVEVGNGF